MTTYRRLARTLPVDVLVEELLARTGYLAAVGAMPDGARCRDDLHAFAGWAAGAGRAGLPTLIRAMDAARDNGGLTISGSATAQKRPGCVSIMTVHRSKGLEFPVVFVANTTHKFNNTDITKPVLSHRQLGIGLTLRAGDRAQRYKTMPYAALAQTIRRETQSEEMRILYVALTRAQDALIITVPLKKPESELKTPCLCASAETTGAEALQGFSNWAGWLLTAALLHPTGSILWNYCDLLPHYKDSTAPLQVRLVKPVEAAERTQQPTQALPDAALQAAILENFRWCSPDAALREIPAKVSVSAVAHAAREVALERPAFMQAAGMTGAEKGTAIHAFMEVVPFDTDSIDLPAEVQRQKDLNLLNPTLAEKLDLSRVEPFFQSEVYRRIRQADRVLREISFITALPASAVSPGVTQSDAPVLVQGIADLVLVFADHAEIIDYKTDRADHADWYVQEYAAQLRLYHRAFARRLPVPVTKLTIYSFTMQQEIDVPLKP